MEALNKAVGAAPEAVDGLRKGTIVAAKFVDDAWYRARVEGTDRDTGKITIRYVDYGNTEETDKVPLLFHMCACFRPLRVAFNCRCAAYARRCMFVSPCSMVRERVHVLISGVCMVVAQSKLAVLPETCNFEQLPAQASQMQLALLAPPPEDYADEASELLRGGILNKVYKCSVESTEGDAQQVTFLKRLV